MDSLVKRAMEHDVNAFAQLIEENTGSMYKVARCFLKNDEDIADAVQDTILTCFEKITTLRQEKYFKTWLIRILINHCKDMLREQKKTCSYAEIPEVQGEGITSGLGVEWRDLLERMDEKYRAVIVLYYLEGFKIKEISKLLDMNLSTVKTRLSRGRKELQRLYREENEDGKGRVVPFQLKEVENYVR